jgi:hypothetical protein
VVLNILAVVSVAILIMVFLGFAALVGGAVIALLASRSAPDGFEDQEGFHLGGVPPDKSAEVAVRVL